MFQLEWSIRFTGQSKILPVEVRQQLYKQLALLQANPRHPSLRTHVVHGRKGDFSEKIFEAYVNRQYRLTFEYKKRDVILLRNVDNHDECLARP